MKASLFKTISPKSQSLLFGLAILIAFSLIFTLNKLYPLFEDDWGYSFIIGNSSQRVSSFKDVVTSQYNHYFEWGGRSVVHAIDQIMLMMDKTSMDIVNSLAFIALITMMYLIINKGNKINPCIVLYLFILVWFLQPAFCATVLWKTGAANYMWGSLIIISFMYFYISYYLENKEQTKNKIKTIIKSLLFFIAGIISGWTNENMGIALILFICIILILLKYEKKKLPIYFFTGLAGSIVGCFLILSAPGNYIRFNKIISDYMNQGISEYEMHITVIKLAKTYFFEYILPLLLSYIVLFIIYNKSPKKPEQQQSIKRISFILLLSGCIAFLVMLGSPMFPTRALFGIIILFLISIGLLYSNINFTVKYLKYINFIFIFSLIIAFSYDYYHKYNTINYIYSFWKNREDIIEEQKRQNIDTVIFSTKIEQPHIKYYMWDLSSDPAYWTNEVYAKYYGLKNIQVIDSQ